jgi:hypothetical protein
VVLKTIIHFLLPNCKLIDFKAIIHFQVHRNEQKGQGNAEEECQ